MIGDREIIQTRMNGYKPTAVYIHTDIVNMRLFDFGTMLPLPDLIIRPDESVEHLDLRFLIGLTCSIAGSDHKRVTAVANACMAAKAKRVVAHFYKKHKAHGGVFMESLERIEDTENIATWESTEW